MEEDVGSLEGDFKSDFVHDLKVDLYVDVQVKIYVAFMAIYLFLAAQLNLQNQCLISTATLLYISLSPKEDTLFRFSFSRNFD